MGLSATVSSAVSTAFSVIDDLLVTATLTSRSSTYDVDTGESVVAATSKTVQGFFGDVESDDNQSNIKRFDIDFYIRPPSEITPDEGDSVTINSHTYTVVDIEKIEQNQVFIYRLMLSK